MTMSGKIRAGLFSAISLVSLVQAESAYAQTESKVSFNIERQSLAEALTAFSEQSGVTLVASADLTAGKQSKGLSGVHTPEDGLNELLDGAGLSLKRSPSGLFMVVEDTAPAKPAPQTKPATKQDVDKSASLNSTQRRDTIIVYGQALSQARSIETKRNSDIILDAIAQDDIGRLPDLNIAQTLVRIPGAAVQNDQGEARFPIIRGLNATYNRTTIDGGIVASPERGGLGRAVPLDLIPASLVSRIEVQKSITPNLDHNAIGGTINLVTRSAFDDSTPFLVGGVYLGDYEQAGKGTTLDGDDKKTTWRANLAAGSRFGPNDQFGAVLGLDYSILNFNIPQIEVDDADYTEFDDLGVNVGLGNGNGLVVPTNTRQFFYNNVRERIGVVAKGEWQPSDAFQAEIALSYNEYNDDERRDEQIYELGTGGGSNQPAQITNQTATSGVTDTGYNKIGIGRFVLDREIINLRSAAEWRFAPGWELDVQAVYTTAELSNPEVTEGFSTDTSFGARYDTSSFFNSVQPLDPVAFYDAENYAFQNRGVLDRFADDEIQEYSADLNWDAPALADWKFATGVLFRTSEKTEGFTFERFIADTGFNYTLALVNEASLREVDYQGGYSFPQRISIEASDAIAQSGNLVSSFTTMSGSTASEETSAAYLMGTWDRGPFNVTGGLRFEQTEFEGLPQGGEVVSGEYSDVLPSINMRYNVRDDVVIRAAASRTLGRPNLNLMTQGVSINTADNTISRSNPDLKPRSSTNFDVSAEWYIGDGILAAGVFYKDIADEIFTLTTAGPVTVDGVTYDALTQPENAESAEIFGFEAQYQQTFGFLPAPWNGLGVAANMTLLDTEFTVPLADGSSRVTGFFQQPDNAYNLTAFYATEVFEMRASYNFTDTFIDTISANNINADEYWDSREQVDLQARFNINSNMTLVGEVQNLTGSGRRELTGPDALYLQEDAVFGRTLWLGLTASF
ncbi:TonB-dependent receptor [Hirschia litorea]|uniref:TonB-dependent receptor n=1 Tax=Hirschia litorea TaxID=1199156 RepID=A0ABW2IPE0_9PROT